MGYVRVQGLGCLKANSVRDIEVAASFTEIGLTLRPKCRIIGLCTKMTLIKTDFLTTINATGTLFIIIFRDVQHSFFPNILEKLIW